MIALIIALIAAMNGGHYAPDHAYYLAHHGTEVVCFTARQSWANTCFAITEDTTWLGP
jgi:hypothetical protein